VSIATDHVVLFVDHVHISTEGAKLVAVDVLSRFINLRDGETCTKTT
jgi:hypothetical protein